IELVAETSEPVVNLAVHEGDHVKAGQLIAQLDTRREQVLLTQAQAARQQAAAGVSSAQASLLNAQQDYDRTRALVKQGSRSPSDLDHASAALATARAALQAAQAAQAGAKAAEQNNAITLARLSLRAPRDATVDALPYHVGERPPVHGVVAVLLDAHAAYAQVYIPEALRSRIRPGMKASVQFDGGTQPHSAEVRFISSDAAFTPYYALTERDRGRLAYLAKVYLDDGADGKLPVGAPVRVSFPGFAP
ncbi:MAG TPA: HlyD family efflux transporter periplasmic adaptor subunit, partial [Gammaproteobacteria bacterium]|nr:HlyD family efflux transporter periplasmic adaptor subunit [Gammaproteobacteria bacterium]